MKKFIKTFLIFLLLAPMLLLAACSDPSSYVITASPSDSLLGSVQGVSTEAMTEGTKITLVAKENTNTATSNPFICWVKDQTKVVSTEKSLELTYNATTAGNYTALFSETDPQKMMYVSIGDISLDSALNIQTINFNDKNKLIKYCQGIQMGSPIDSNSIPEPWDMPGYTDQVIMAAGAFTQGSSIELSCDGPIRPPYTAFMQGGLTYEYGKLGVLKAVQNMIG